MKNIAVTALVEQDVDGRSVGVGEVFEVPPVQAAILNYQQKVRLGGYVTKVETPEPTSETAPEPEKPRRRYRRRDMTADPQ